MLTVKESEYVKASRLLGASAGRALPRDVLPNIVGPVLILAMLELGTAVLLRIVLPRVGSPSPQP